MNNIKTAYALFDIFDYKNEQVTTTYNLPITPLTFKGRIPTQTLSSTPINSTKTVFDFGDGTLGHGLTSTHIYSNPGQYNVKMVIRDCDNNAILASYNTDVTITDYIANTFTVVPSAAVAGTESLSGLIAGEWSVPIEITIKSPYYQDFQDLYFSVSGLNIPNYFDLDKNKFNHLKKYFTVATREYIDTLSSYEYVDVETVSLTSADVYVQLKGTDLVSSSVSAIDSIFVGSTGSNFVYFKTDMVDNDVSKFNLSFNKDRSNVYSPGFDGYENNDYLNNFLLSLSASVSAVAANQLSAISITSNGLSNEGAEPNSFPINDVQYKGVGIPFVLKPVNTSYTVKALSASPNPTFEVLSGLTVPGVDGIVPESYYTVSSLSATLSTVDTDFWYRGIVTFNDNVSGSSTNLTLSTSNSFLSGNTSTTLKGKTHFTCYPKTFYTLYKQNEDFNFEQTIKDLRFQEILLDKDILFTDFIGTIFGNVSSDYKILGKKIYESIFNFVPNTMDIDVCDISHLLSISDMLGEDGIVFNRNAFRGPADIKRMANIQSVKYNKLRGISNKFNENYFSFGRSEKTTYGRNLSSQLDPRTYEVSPGVNIVAYEKFSETYVTLNTYQPLSALSGGAGTGKQVYSQSGNAGTYMLSDYSTSVPTGSATTSSAPYWGWPLVLPSTYTIEDVESYYEFYSLSGAYDNTMIGGMVDYSNILTTLSSTIPLSSLEGDNKIFDVMLRDTLFSSLSLFE